MIIKQIKTRLKEVVKIVNEVLEYNLLYHGKLRNASVDLEQVVSGLQKLVKLAEEISLEVRIIIDALVESGQMTDELAEKLASVSTLGINLQSLAKFDPETVAEFLSAPNRKTREEALKLIDHKVVESWFQSITRFTEGGEDGDT